MVRFVRRLVECESPSRELEAVNRFVELVADTMAPWSAIRTSPGGQY